MPFLLWHQKKSNTCPWQIHDVRKHRCGFLTQKRGPKLHPNHGRQQPDQPPWGIDDANCRHHNVKTPLEQRVEHTTGKVHVHWLEFFYLSALLERYEYMCIPIGMLPIWIVEQYDLTNKIVKGHVYLKMRCAVWGLPKQAYWQTNYSASVSLPMDTTNASKRQDYGDMPHTPFPSPWWWMILVWNKQIRTMSTI